MTLWNVKGADKKQLNDPIVLDHLSINLDRFLFLNYRFLLSLSITAPLRASVIVCFREMAFVFSQTTPNTGLTYQKLFVYVDREDLDWF